MTQILLALYLLVGMMLHSSIMKHADQEYKKKDKEADKVPIGFAGFMLVFLIIVLAWPAVVVIAMTCAIILDLCKLVTKAFKRDKKP